MLFPSFKSLKASVEHRQMARQCQICFLLLFAFVHDFNESHGHDDLLLIGIDQYIVSPEGSRDGLMTARWGSLAFKLDVRLVSLPGERF
jgi:hypothetical protein